jgi:hypothetical protein
VSANLKFGLCPPVLRDRYVTRHVLSDIAAPLGVLKNPLETRQHLLRHGAGHRLNQFVPKDLDTRRGQPRKFLITNAGKNMQSGVLLILLDGCSLTAFTADIGKPILGGLSDRDALAGRRMDALLDIDRNLGLASVGILLALESFDMARTVRGVVTDPRFLGLNPNRFSSLFDIFLRIARLTPNRGDLPGFRIDVLALKDW